MGDSNFPPGGRAVRAAKLTAPSETALPSPRPFSVPSSTVGALKIFRSGSMCCQEVERLYFPPEPASVSPSGRTESPSFHLDLTNALLDQTWLGQHVDQVVFQTR